MRERRAFAVGETMVFERTFTDEEVLSFQRLSGDAGRHHARPEPGRRRVVHGLLTATLPTKIGGELDFLARDMVFEFLRPVFVGDVIRCELTITEVEPEASRVRLTLAGACRNQDGREVLRFRSRGVVLDDGGEKG